MAPCTRVLAAIYVFQISWGSILRCPAAAMVHYSLVMVPCLNFMLFRVSRRLRARARARVRFVSFCVFLCVFACFLCVFVRFRTVQYKLNKIPRFYALTPKIMYLGQFLYCMVRCYRKVVWRRPLQRDPGFSRRS